MDKVVEDLMALTNFEGFAKKHQLKEDNGSDFYRLVKAVYISIILGERAEWFCYGEMYIVRGAMKEHLANLKKLTDLGLQIEVSEPVHVFSETLDRSSGMEGYAVYLKVKR